MAGQPGNQTSPSQPKKYSSVVCSFIWPKHPGYTGGEIREYHLLRGLLAASQVTFLSLTSPAQDSRQELLGQVEALYSPENIQKAHLSLGMQIKLIAGKIHTLLHKHQIPVIGPRYHAEFTYFSRQVEFWALPTLRQIFQTQPPDFLFVSPQLNPLALQLEAAPPKTRLIFATYDVEATRLARLEATYRGLPRLAAHLETRRARRFERDNLIPYDGLIAVSDLDRETFARDYGFPPERILVIENSVDTDYFAFHPRNETDEKNIVFTANLGYRPNDDAARRLLTGIMPLVRRKIPAAKAWIVGQLPGRELLGLANEKNIVTGRVEDVRPYLQQASAACMPLRAGSG
ncbi:MAG: glycosyltransferase, partial [Chloroflexi bacterium]